MLKNIACAGLGLGLLVVVAPLAAKPPAEHPNSVLGSVSIDNGISGDGAVVVSVLAGGGAGTLTVDPTGSTGPSQVIYEYFPYIGPVSGAATYLGSTVTTGPTLTGPNQVTSSGTYVGPNGDIQWTAVSSIQAGSPVYQTRITLTSAQPLGAVRLGAYLDEDVLGAGGDVLVLFGTPGAADFQALTVDGSANVGVAQSADYSGSTNATYAGWAAAPYSQLRSEVYGGTVTYSTAGVISNLPAYVDPRYPGQPAYGQADITTAFAFDVDPAATTATITVSLGGSPDGQPPGGGGEPPVVTPITPVPGLTWFGLLATALVLLAAAARGFTRRSRG